MTVLFSHGYALLIAVDESAEPGWALPDVAKDVNAMQAVLMHPERCAFLPDNVKVAWSSRSTLRPAPNGPVTVVYRFRTLAL